MSLIFWEGQKQGGSEVRHPAPCGWEKGRMPKNLERKPAHCVIGQVAETAGGKMGVVRKKPVIPVSQGQTFGLFLMEMRN